VREEQALVGGERAASLQADESLPRRRRDRAPRAHDSPVRGTHLRHAHTLLVPLSGDFSHKPKETNRRPLLADIHTFGHSRKTRRSKGGTEHITTRILRDEGQAVVEYAAILALVAALLVFAFSSLGAATVHLFDEVVSQWP
jgi:Flp pilus assembly pilin Flp